MSPRPADGRIPAQRLSPESAAAAPRLDQRLRDVVGARTANPLASLDLYTVEDLLRHAPRRYDPPGQLTDLHGLTPGDHVAVMARVDRVTTRTTRNGGGLLEAVVTDGVARLSLTFFGRSTRALRSHEAKLLPGRVGMFTGTVRLYRGAVQLTHPDYHVVGVDTDDEAAALAEGSRPTPVYPSAQRVPTWVIRRAVRAVLDPLRPEDVPDPLPEEVRQRRGLTDLHRAFLDVHLPFSDREWRRGRHRLRYEEAFLLQTALARRRAEAAATPAISRAGAGDGAGLLARFDAALPFALTDGQLEVGREISADLAAPRPMQRLLQGEVGSGKTVVALRAILQVVDSGGQAALLAPTEVLAAQHLRSLRALLGPLAEEGLLADPETSTRVVLLTGSQGAAARRSALSDIASGRAGIVVGTHALLGEKVGFADLGLVVVDEQHRFGVEQRDALRTRAAVAPHLLVMTATPIPRTVAMTVFGDLVTSTLREVPGGRPGITSHVVAADNRRWVERMWHRVREEVDRGHRVYVVCPRISAADDSPEDKDSLLAPEAEDEGLPQRPALRAVEEVVEELRGVLRGVEVRVLHGRMSGAEKDAAMAAFADGRSPVLVTTTVVEVGVDVPEATVMVVLDADRFGLSQLHQLRGRVGRGTAPGLCLLVSSAPEGSLAARRVETLAGSTDGFELAAADLQLRREGDVLGASQSGRGSSLRHLEVLRDVELIEHAREDAQELVDHDPDLETWPALRRSLERWLDPRREEFLERA